MLLHGAVESDRTGIKQRIFEKVRQRVAEESEGRQPHNGNSTGNTERFDRVLALWVNLQKAMQFQWNEETREDVPAPWDCQDTRVRKAWDAFTHPRNEVALEILTYQLPEGQELETVRKALQACRQRRRGIS
jgi:hypothetical protein